MKSIKRTLAAGVAGATMLATAHVATADQATVTVAMTAVQSIVLAVANNLNLGTLTSTTSPGGTIAVGTNGTVNNASATNATLASPITQVGVVSVDGSASAAVDVSCSSAASLTGNVDDTIAFTPAVTFGGGTVTGQAPGSATVCTGVGSALGAGFNLDASGTGQVLVAGTLDLAGSTIGGGALDSSFSGTVTVEVVNQ